MTDAPACGFDHVFVTVDKIRVHTSANAEDGTGGWSEIDVNPSRRIDLLSLQNGTLTKLGQTVLPAGQYQQIRLVLDRNTGNSLANSVVPAGGAEQPLDTPSATQSGYKIIRPFTVQRDTLVDLVLDFDACRSIVQRGNGFVPAAAPRVGTYQPTLPIALAADTAAAGKYTVTATSITDATLSTDRDVSAADATANFAADWRRHAARRLRGVYPARCGGDARRGRGRSGPRPVSLTAGTGEEGSLLIAAWPLCNE